MIEVETSKVIRRLDDIHQKLLTAIASLSDEQFSQRPSDGGWCVGEIVHHLNMVDERVTKELRHGLKHQPRRLNLLKRLKPTSIVSLRLVKVKAPKTVTPVGELQKETTMAAFETARTNLKALYKEQGEGRLQHSVLRHPFLGEISGVAAFSFVAYHEKRHYKQIREVLKNLARHSAIK